MTPPIPTNSPTGSDQQERGLTSAEARLRLAVTGHNSLPAKKPVSFVSQLGRQFANPLIYILLFALLVDFTAWWQHGAQGWPVESLVIAAILILNATLGVWQERKAEAALARLKGLAAPQAWVMRDGSWQRLDTAELTPGDYVRVESGDRVPADGTLDGPDVAVDESILTGESVPVEKGNADELLSGTLVVRGRSFMDVTRTGTRSALGRIAGMLEDMEEEKTPLERRLGEFARRVARWVIVLCLILIAQGIATQGWQRWAEVFLFAVALAVAAVPEGLPAVMTLTLALGVERMAARKAVVRRLAAVEALGSVTVILTDKTGTLTENQMHVRSIDATDQPALLRAISLANDADDTAGDPVDLALAAYARTQGVEPKELRKQHPRVSARDFDSRIQFQRVSVDEGGRTVSYLKGAPEKLIARSRLSTGERRTWNERAAAGAGNGDRMLAAARGEGEAEENLEFLGLIHMWDPLRPEIPGALELAQRAGIRVAMVTGDHPATAAAIAKLAGLDTSKVITGDDLDNLTTEPAWAGVYARVRPEHKLMLVEALQRQGEVVAMTGDGVNDAPALKRADVGVAMGQRGSDVSREVADIVILDDNFATIVAAIEEGRGIYENTQKFIRFLFSTNLAEVIVISVGVMLSSLLGLHEQAGGLLLPLTAVQILWINLVTDGMPALALSLDRNPGVMSQAPRPASSPLLDRTSLRFVFAGGLTNGLIALGLLGLSEIGWIEPQAARSAMFQFLAICQLFYSYPSRHTAVMPLRNMTLHAAVALGIVLQVFVGIAEAPARLLGLVPLTPQVWGIVFCAALGSWALAEMLNRLLWRAPARAAT